MLRRTFLFLSTIPGAHSAEAVAERRIRSIAVTRQVRLSMAPLMYAALRQSTDLILMDIQSPGVSGLEVTEWLKDDENIAVTAFAMTGDEEKILNGRLRRLYHHLQSSTE